MRRALKWVPVPALVVVALLATQGTLAGTSSKLSAKQGSQTFTVDVDGVNPAANETFYAYFPKVVKVHSGDTVVFHYVGVGEPHTVALGTLANAAVSAFASLTPAQQNHPPASAVAADAALPQLFPQGPGDAIASAANPCYMQSGTPGTSICPNSQHEQPDFNGSQSYYDSGWLNTNQKWTVHLSSGTPAGVYRYLCLLHREFMSGQIDVMPSSTSVPSPSAQTAAGQKQIAGWEAQLQGAVQNLRQGKPPDPHITLPAGNVILTGSGGQVPAQVDEYGPKTIKVPVGGSVTWYLVGDHSITFNSDKTNNDVRLDAPDGTVHINPQAVAPVNGPGEPPPGKPSGNPNGPPTFKVVASKTWDGSGFLNSGVFVNSFGPPLIEGYKVTFTKAGTYKFICTVHDHMKGTVVVG
jgi:plastocyanin